METKSIIPLNLRGTLFWTKLSTLTSDVATNTLFPTLVSLLNEKEDCILLDRDPRYFHWILNYFCQPDKWVGPTDRDSILALKIEADYYLMPKGFYLKLQYKDMLLCNFKESDKKITRLPSGIFDMLSVNPESFITYSSTGCTSIYKKYDFSSYDMFLTHINILLKIDNEEYKKLDSSSTTTLSCSNGFTSTKYNPKHQFKLSSRNLIHYFHVCFEMKISIQPIRNLKLRLNGKETKIKDIEVYGKVYERFLPWKSNESFKNDENAEVLRLHK